MQRRLNGVEIQPVKNRIAHIDMGRFRPKAERIMMEVYRPIGDGGKVARHKKDVTDSVERYTLSGENTLRISSNGRKKTVYVLKEDEQGHYFAPAKPGISGELYTIENGIAKPISEEQETQILWKSIEKVTVGATTPENEIDVGVSAGNWKLSVKMSDIEPKGEGVTYKTEDGRVLKARADTEALAQGLGIPEFAFW